MRSSMVIVPYRGDMKNQGVALPEHRFSPTIRTRQDFEIIGTGSQACQRRRGVCEKSLLKSLVEPLRCPGSHGGQKRRFCAREYPKQDQIRLKSLASLFWICLWISIAQLTASTALANPTSAIAHKLDDAPRMGGDLGSISSRLKAFKRAKRPGLVDPHEA